MAPSPLRFGRRGINRRLYHGGLEKHGPGLALRISVAIAPAAVEVTSRCAGVAAIDGTCFLSCTSA